ncbi:MAG: hypothetical protein WD096_01280 [Actinomycetota bacterium]
MYTTGPIDYWTAWSSVGEVVQKQVPAEQEEMQRQLERLLEHATDQVRQRGSHWEGDIIQGPYFAGLPNGVGDPDSDLMVGFKQSNNGTCYFWSPHELTWIQEW